jgi:hypothetical protein
MENTLEHCLVGSVNIMENTRNQCHHDNQTWQWEGRSTVDLGDLKPVRDLSYKHQLKLMWWCWYRRTLNVPSHGWTGDWQGCQRGQTSWSCSAHYYTTHCSIQVLGSGLGLTAHHVKEKGAPNQETNSCPETTSYKKQVHVMIQSPLPGLHTTTNHFQDYTWENQ